MNARGLPACTSGRPCFEPTFQKHAGKPCGGCQIHVIDRAAFRPVRGAAASLLECFRAAIPAQFEWRPPPYEYEHDKMPIDILAGSSALRQQIESQMPFEDILESWEPGLTEFEEIRGEFLLY